MTLGSSSLACLDDTFSYTLLDLIMLAPSSTILPHSRHSTKSFMNTKTGTRKGVSPRTLCCFTKDLKISFLYFSPHSLEMSSHIIFFIPIIHFLTFHLLLHYILNICILEGIYLIISLYIASKYIKLLVFLKNPCFWVKKQLVKFSTTKEFTDITNSQCENNKPKIA